MITLSEWKNIQKYNLLSIYFIFKLLIGPCLYRVLELSLNPQSILKCNNWNVILQVCLCFEDPICKISYNCWLQATKQKMSFNQIGHSMEWTAESTIFSSSKFFLHNLRNNSQNINVFQKLLDQCYPWHKQHHLKFIMSWKVI